jgi:hypothetical protein
MTSEEFVIWLSGFIEACNDLVPTPKQWDSIKEKLEKISDNKGVSIGIGGTGVLNTGTNRYDLTNLPSGTNMTYTTKQQLND